MIKSYITIITFCFFLLENVSAQCSVNKYDLKGGYVNEAEYEEISNTRGDLSKGYFVVFGQLSKIVATNNNKHLYQLNIATSARGEYAKIVPREIVIYFTNKAKLILFASRYSSKEELDICYFDVTDYDIKLFNNEITGIEITDTRTWYTYSIIPDYSFIFKEQYICIEKN